MLSPLSSALPLALLRRTAPRLLTRLPIGRSRRPSALSLTRFASTGDKVAESAGIPMPAHDPLAEMLSVERKLGELRAQIRSDLQAGRLQSAKTAAQAFHDSAVAFFGPKHSVVASGLHNLALVHKELGELEVAVKHYETARELYEELLGPDHSSTLTTLTNIGLMMRLLAERSKGLEKTDLLDSSARCLQRVVSTRQRVGHVKDSSLYVGMAHLAATMRVQKRYKEAEDLLVDAAGLVRKHFGNDHECLGLLLNNLGYLLKETAEYDRAERCYLEALRIREAALGERHQDTVSTQHNLAELLLVMGQNERATELQVDLLRKFGHDTDTKPDNNS